MSNAAPSSLRRSQGQIVVARALWYVKPGQCELRTERLAAPRPGEARVATHYSAISRGTERLIAAGKVPESEWQRMRAPLQAGEFPFPVKYGYSAAGVVSAGSDALIGRRVFCLHPHQDAFQAGEDKLILVPDGIPLKRATLAANMETALNAHWDAGTAPGDSVAVIGAGVVGLLVAHLAQSIAGTRVVVADIDPARAPIAEALGLAFVRPDAVKANHRIVFHTSATAAGLDCALHAAQFEGRVIEMSWYGTTAVTVDLGSAFHARRLSLISSQVGHVAPSQRQCVTHAERLALALQMLHDPRLDALVASETPFETLPDTLPPLLTATTSALAPVIRYPAASQ